MSHIVPISIDLVFTFPQESKRSAQDLCGRNDGNVKVIFPRQEVAGQPTDTHTSPINPGDYVLVKVHFHSAVAVSYDIFYHTESQQDFSLSIILYV